MVYAMLKDAITVVKAEPAADLFWYGICKAAF